MSEQQQTHPLAEIPGRWASPPAEMVGKLPRGGDKDRSKWQWCNVCNNKHAANAVHLDYMGHAEVTLALCDIDPLWNWEPVAFDTNGLPLIEWGSAEDEMAVMWVRLTLHGHSRLGVGSVEKSKSDIHKELIGDALRNAAMRFGVGTNLWSKSAPSSSSSNSGGGSPRPSAPAGRVGPAQVNPDTGVRFLTSQQIRRAAAGLVRTHRPTVGVSELDKVVKELLDRHGQALTGNGPWPETEVGPVLDAVTDELTAQAA